MFRLPHVQSLPLIVLCALLVACTLPAFADLTLGGGARSIAMGGAGLASGDTQEAALNPAFLADTGTRLGLIWPTLDTRMSGAASLGDVIDLLGHSKLNAGKALDLVKNLGSGPAELDASARAGLLLPQSDLQVSAAIRTVITPNPDFAEWVRSGGDIGALARADVKAIGITNLPSVGVGFHAPVPLKGKTSVGLRLKPTQAYYSHFVFDGTHLDSNGVPIPQLAVEMGNKSVLKQSTFSADMGAMFTPTRFPNVHIAAMIANLIEPKAIKFSSDAGGSLEEQIAPRTISVGSAWVNKNVTLAMDLVDIGSHFGKSNLRLGGELRGPSSIALRGGYNTEYGFTGGIGYGGFNLAYSQKAPLMISGNAAF